MRFVIKYKQATIILTCIVLSAIVDLCASQNYYYNNINYPYRRTGYRYNTATATQTRRPQTTSRLPARALSVGASSFSTSTSTSNKNGYNSNSLAETATKKPTTTSQPGKYNASKADAENAKFAGLANQEDEEESGRGLHFFKRPFFNRQRPLADPCRPYGRTVVNDQTTPAPREQGRFLWDLNVYNVYPAQQPLPLYSNVPQAAPYGVNCDGYGGGLLGYGGIPPVGGYLGDPIQQPYATSPLNNFLTYFAPGILQNALAATARPRPPPPLQTPVNGGNENDVDPAVDPGYIPTTRRPNRLYFDASNAPPPLTPAQLVGGVATTVNGIIQQLTGNLQPIYPTYRNTRSYG